MGAQRFSNEYERVAPLHELAPEDLAARDQARKGTVLRWMAISGGRAVGAATASLRPDDRMFVQYVGRDSAPYPALTGAIAADLQVPLYTSGCRRRGTISRPRQRPAK